MVNWSEATFSLYFNLGRKNEEINQTSWARHEIVKKNGKFFERDALFFDIKVTKNKSRLMML